MVVLTLLAAKFEDKLTLVYVLDRILGHYLVPFLPDLHLVRTEIATDKSLYAVALIAFHTFSAIILPFSLLKQQILYVHVVEEADR